MAGAGGRGHHPGISLSRAVHPGGPAPAGGLASPCAGLRSGRRDGVIRDRAGHHGPRPFRWSPAGAGNSRLEAANQGGQVIGPGVAGLLAAAGLLRGTMLIDALTFGVSLASLGALRGGYRAVARAGRTTASLSALRRDLADGVRYLAATRLLLALMGFVLVLNLCLGADKLFVFFAKDTLGLRAWQVGVVVTVGGVGGVLGAAATGWWCRRVGPLPGVASCAVASGVALIMLSTAWSMPVMMAANLLYTWAIVAASVTLRALRQVLVPRELLGRVTAAWRLAAQVVTPIGAVAAGAMTGYSAATRGPSSRSRARSPSSPWGAPGRLESGGRTPPARPPPRCSQDEGGTTAASARAPAGRFHAPSSRRRGCARSGGLISPDGSERRSHRRPEPRDLSRSATTCSQREHCRRRPPSWPMTSPENRGHRGSGCSGVRRAPARRSASRLLASPRLLARSYRAR